MTRIVVIDAGIGNVGSVACMLRFLGFNATVTNSRVALGDASHLILPGVGSFGEGSKNLTVSGIGEIVQRRARVGVPVLGICLGMQLLADSSEEGVGVGLGLIPGQARRLDAAGVRVPHMGWNEVNFVENSKLATGFAEVPRFYFVHSFHVVPRNRGHISAVTQYGGEIAAAIEKDNVLGVQFHPEKSHRFGMQLFRQFIGNAQ